MGKLEDVKSGWDFMAKMLSGDLSGHSAFSDYVENLAQNESINMQNMRIQEINDAIDKLAQSINKHPHLNLNVEQFKGFVAEEWHAGTFNIDALRKGSDHRAWTLQDNGYGSVDVETNFRKEYSLKYSNTAKEAKEGGVDLEKRGYTKDPLLEEVRINYVNQAMKAGLTAAAITAITQIVPELYKAVDYLIKHGEIDLNGLKKSGKKIISVTGEAFLRGSLAYGVEMVIQQGILGESFKGVNPSIIGVAVTVILGTIKDSILIAAGKMSATEMGMHFVDMLVVTSGYLVSMKIGGAIAQALFPELPGFAYAIGSFLGCSVAVVYNIGKRKLISFCVDTGFTCFGLVEQNYELPEDVLEERGVHTIPVPRVEISRTEVNCMLVDKQINRTEYETIDITILRRGIIGVNRIGYVPV